MYRSEGTKSCLVSALRHAAAHEALDDVLFDRRRHDGEPGGHVGAHRDVSVDGVQLLPFEALRDTPCRSACSLTSVRRKGVRREMQELCKLLPDCVT